MSYVAPERTSFSFIRITVFPLPGLWWLASRTLISLPSCTKVIPALKSLAEIIIFAPSFLYHNQLYCIRQPARKLEYSLSFKVSCLFVRKINTGKRCYRNIFFFQAFDFYFFSCYR
ncbi:hypothetical protein CU019_2312 [Enterococcus faecium]|nr:hypothetical protein [Enterococcus faecium]MBK4788729.1 hypothetical protein [Enterococcus faecium]MBK4791377.1 hypothetical protein [Enterococcus faecium]MBK4799509.1 hypothetical protein [Enterococcus faecium]MBK4810062.1 hypothetical protein [Enterococcus faecium]